jgi:hypothetical protein
MARQTIQNANASLVSGTSSNVALAQTSGLPLYSTAGYSIAARFKYTDVQRANTVYSEGNSGVNTQYFLIDIGNASTIGRFRVKIVNNAGTIVCNKTSTTGVAQGNWCDIVWVDNAGVCTLYINGVADATNFDYTQSGSYTLDRSTIGALTRDTTTNNLKGNLLDFQLFNYGLTAAQVSAVRGGQLKGNVGNYPLSEGAGTVAYDTSGNGNNGIITAGTYTADVPTKKREVVGGNMVKNGDFEYAPPFVAAQTDEFKYIDGTATGSTNRLFGWAIFSRVVGSSAQFDNTVKHSGSNSLKLSTTDASGYISVGTFASVAIPLATSFRSQLIPVQPSTSYTASVYMKTNNAAANSVWVDFREVNGGLTLGTSNLTTKLAGTNEWGKYTVTFTTADTCRYITPLLKIGVAGNISDAWFDDIQLYPTTPITRSAATGRLTATGRSAA